MAYILAFSGSNSSTSINHKLVKYTSSLLTDEKIRLLDMSNFPFPMYSEDYEKEHGYSNSLVEFMDEINNAKGLVISVSEHNSYPTAYFKNTLDWLSRLDSKFLSDKKILLMAASPGGRGAIGALEASENMLKRFGANIVETFSFPSFHQNFDENKGILDENLAKIHREKTESFKSVIS